MAINISYTRQDNYTCIQVEKDGQTSFICLDASFYVLEDGSHGVYYYVSTDGVNEENYDTFLEARKAIVQYITEQLQLDEDEKELLFYYTQDFLDHVSIVHDAYELAYYMIEKMGMRTPEQPWAHSDIDEKGIINACTAYRAYLEQSRYVLPSSTEETLKRQWGEALKEVTGRFNIYSQRKFVYDTWKYIDSLGLHDDMKEKLLWEVLHGLTKENLQNAVQQLCQEKNIDESILRLYWDDLQRLIRQYKSFIVLPIAKSSALYDITHEQDTSIFMVVGEDNTTLEFHVHTTHEDGKLTFIYSQYIYNNPIGKGASTTYVIDSEHPLSALRDKIAEECASVLGLSDKDKERLRTELEQAIYQKWILEDIKERATEMSLSELLEYINKEYPRNFETIAVDAVAIYNDIRYNVKKDIQQKSDRNQNTGPNR